MPRPPRLEFPGAFYHVFTRGNRREAVFLTQEDYRRFEAFLTEVAALSQVLLYAWCLMPNHIHILLQTPRGNLSVFMRRLLTRYAHSFNRAHRLVGHVFQGRYKAILCDKEAYLLELIRYIYLNPLRVKKAALASRPEEWPWSSHRHYLAGEAPPALSPQIRGVLMRFSSHPARALRRYQEFVEGRGQESFEELLNEVKEGRFLGGDGFVEQAKINGFELADCKNASLRRIKNPTELLGEAVRLFGVSQERLRAPSQERRLSRIRQAFVFVGRQVYRFSSTSLGQSIGREPSAVSHICRKLEASRGQTPEISLLLEGLSLQSEKP